MKQVAEVPLSETERHRIVGLLDRRARGEQMVETYWETKQSDEAKIRAQLRLSVRKLAAAVLFSNVVWDTARSARPRYPVFGHVRLDHRNHPIVSGTSAMGPRHQDSSGRNAGARARIHDRVADQLKAFDRLPDNVRIILPEEPIDSYVLMRMATVGCVYASTVGLEMAAAGVPVVVVQSSWFYLDLTDRARSSGGTLRRRWRESMPDDERNRESALQYAYVFFSAACT
ncbi:MAG: hypothetical protein U0231_14785 [Nitrospiraceae bacterium]